MVLKCLHCSASYDPQPLRILFTSGERAFEVQTASLSVEQHMTFPAWDPPPRAQILIFCNFPNESSASRLISVCSDIDDTSKCLWGSFLNSMLRRCHHMTNYPSKYPVPCLKVLGFIFDTLRPDKKVIWNPLSKISWTRRITTKNLRFQALVISVEDPIKCYYWRTRQVSQ